MTMPTNDIANADKIGPAPRPVDVPTIRDYKFEPNEETGLRPRADYAGCVALIPSGPPGNYEVALYVSKAAPHGVAWVPPAGTLVLDLPGGFSINDGRAILQWLRRSGVG